MNRASAARLIQAATLAAVRGIPLPASDRNAAWRQVILWDEHTWGADRSISDPDLPDVVAQWTLKQRFALDADSASRALLGRAGALKTAGRGLDIWNIHAFTDVGVRIIPAALSQAGDRLTGANGAPVPSQRLRDGTLAAQLDLRPMAATRVMTAHGTATASRHPPARALGDSIWNGQVVVHVDPASGAVVSVRWQGRELVDRARGGWNRYRYLLGRDTSKAQEVARSRIEVLDGGPLVATLRITSTAPGAVTLVRDVTLHAGSDAVTIVTHLDKALVRDKEAVHFAFPLAVPGGTVRMEQGLAVVRPDSDQAVGANRNLYPVQRWLDASNAAFGVTIVTPDLPLWELNGLTAEAFKQADGREDWMRRSLPGTELIAYAMNNYWHTNYKADQPGLVTFRVTLLPHGPFDAAAATRAGLAANEPPVVLPAEATPVRASLFTLDNPAVIVSSVTPSADGRAVIVRLWNPGTAVQRAGFRWGGTRPPRITKSSPFEERGPLAPARIEVPGLGSVTVRVERATAR